MKIIGSRVKVFVSFLSGLMLLSTAYAVPARVGYIVDGDTFSGVVRLEDDIEISVRIRLRNVDTPELHGGCVNEIIMANLARDRLAELMPVGSTVDLQNIKDDKYLGRIDANVILPDGRDVGDVLIAEKHGRPYGGGRRAPWCD
ncbi:MAG: hypothetical protein NC311_03660 [Muribaculaceae bacterium]|nr:hypothetical protein [Muribaculaceae bacterium]